MCVAIGCNWNKLIGNLEELRNIPGRMASL